ncbi:VanZ family protein [Mucilaginibacter robiniae]|uniref:VanZ family protein n=1 Tax=Mucilaginibacter robiniae TaxID=2728022 RepID=A0A7L5E2C9_9SPHI|nr:VanZ family protein [Mucilaginibacter robiniae]QJD96469.1 VanZ family protein [Mucilaginibacter robiniae]
MSAETHSSLFFPGFDKLVHCGFFFVFATLACNGVIRRKGAQTILNAISIVVISIGFGAMIEIMQKFIFTWRDGDWGDLFADSTGAAMAVFAILVTVFSATRYEKN